MQTHVRPIGGDLDGRSKAGQFVNAEGTVVLTEQIVDRLNQPAWLTKFEGVAVVPGQGLQKLRQATQVQSPFGRKLKQDWSQLFPQSLGSRQKVVESVLGFLQLLVVSQESAGFDGKFEIFWRRVAPCAQALDFREPIEAVVDLNRVKTLLVVGQHLRCGKLLRIKPAHPVLVVPSAGSNAKVGHCGCRTRQPASGDASDGQAGVLARSSRAMPFPG